MHSIKLSIAARGAVFIVMAGVIAVMSYSNAPWKSEAASEGQTVPTNTPTVTATQNQTIPSATPTATSTPPTATPTATSTPPTATATPSMTPVIVGIVDETGGQVTVFLQGLTINLNFPAGFFTQTVNVSIGNAAMQPVPPGRFLIGDGAFYIEAHVQSTGEALTTFSSFFVLTVGYSAQQSVAFPQSSHLSYWDPNTPKWISLPSAVNVAQRQIFASVNHLSVFAAFGITGHSIYFPIVRR